MTTVVVVIRRGSTTTVVMIARRLPAWAVMIVPMHADLDRIRRELEQRSTDELTHLLRERDEEEWIPEVFGIVTSILETRGVSTASLPAPIAAPDADTIDDHEELAAVGRFFSPAVAHACRMALEEAGIEAWILDESAGASFGVGIGIEVRVRARDLDAAREILESAPAPASDLPPDIAEAPCRHCGSTQVTQRVVDSPPGREPGDADGYGPWRYRCAACGQEWSD
jgi:hypothetical protein